jgi:hypothetical protein
MRRKPDDPLHGHWLFAAIIAVVIAGCALLAAHDSCYNATTTSTPGSCD